MDLQKIVTEIMVEACDTDEIAGEPDLDLFDAGFLDSLATVNIILLIEEKLNIRLQPTDFAKENISSINNLCKFLEQKVK